MGFGNVCLILAVFLFWFHHGCHSKLLYGCVYEETLCEDDEMCVEDGMFGRCQREDSDPMDYSQLSEVELELLRLELTRLVGLGLKWHSAETQCVVSYFFMTRKEHFRFDPEFCNVRNPANILELTQLAERAADKLAVERAIANVENELSKEGAVYSDPDYDENGISSQALDDRDYDYDTDLEVKRLPLAEVILPRVGEDGNDEPSDSSAGEVEDGDSVVEVRESEGEEGLETPLSERDALLSNVVSQLVESVDREGRATPLQTGDNNLERKTGEREEEEYSLTVEEERRLNDMLLQVMSGQTPDLSQLSNSQLDKFIKYVELMQSLLHKEDGQTEGEVAEPNQQFDSDSDSERLLLKKDEEEIGNLDLGLENQAHNIVKGEGHGKPVEHSLQKIRGNRVYIHTNKDISEDTGRMMQLVNYLKEKIAKPKKLLFTDFKFDPNEISFDVGRAGKEGEKVSEKWLGKIFGASPTRKRVPSSDGFRAAAAIANNKRKLETLVGQNQVIWGGSSKRSDGAVVEKGEDAFVLPTLIVCGLIVGVLVSLLSVYIYRNRSRARSTLKRLAADLEGQPTKAYEELCRQRMAGKNEGPEPLGTVINTLTQRLGSQSEGGAKGTSPRTSTSSWSEEPVHITNMDISTGHLILSYLEEHLQNKDKLEEDWQALSSYRADLCESLVGALKENQEKNRKQTAVPYDHARIALQSEAGDSPSEYINASPLYDHDPKNPVYILTQAPLMPTASDFWQMIWEQGSVVIVNLTKLVEDGKNLCHRYWPENGSEVYGVFEVHLVSEHIWCEDYLVRSFYLKNLRTNETRTVTQFHFLSWKEGGLPQSPKPLLEFRRKVNKSYRGRSCPIVVHCSDGADRSGTYCLLDMVLNRINKGVKEIDIAATLEHLRDQRMNLVGSKAEYEFVLTCVAEEVQAIIKALPQQ